MIPPIAPFLPLKKHEMSSFKTIVVFKRKCVKEFYMNYHVKSNYVILVRFIYGR